MMRPASFLAATLFTLAAWAGSMAAAQAGGLPTYQYKLFCKALGRGQAVMVQNCETQEVLSYQQLRTIWRTPPAEDIQDKCYARNQPDKRTGSGSYVKYLNCIITNTGNG
ncbi:hypothetical protein GCM10007874_60800 [Labrys miyagiensis]|uniref:Uncharacterized protein n=1 Tax=Labrys miyagiensis TaxID=346912 RepID=A0ABQ6CSG8_9HYPH|nr:hypothetical protein [Labrys miyagiensis]GLS23060.1 hypothetical protein GCM10007874_60800 [Labrys miyagiensis]